MPLASIASSVFSITSALAFASLLVMNARAGEAPALETTYPLAARPGATIRLGLRGERIEDATELWLSFPGTVQPVAGENAFDVTVASTTPVQLGAIRVLTPRGISNLRLLMVDDLPSVRAETKGHSRAEARALPVGCAVDGYVTATREDYFRVSLKTDESLSIEVVARRLGSPLDPLVRVVDSAGKELTSRDDTPGLLGDCRFSFTASATGDYWIAVRDIQYRGGEAFVYRLRLGDFPLVTCAFPMASPRDGDLNVEAIGEDAGDIDQQAVVTDYDAKSESRGPAQRALAFRRRGGRSSAFVVLDSTDTPEFVETEPNNAREFANACEPPTGINGRFETPGDEDWYAWNLEAGERVEFAIDTERLGSPSRVYLRFYGSEGELLHASHPTGAARHEGTVGAAEPGRYFLRVEELHRRGGPEHAYRIALRRARPLFRLTVDADYFNAPAGGVFVAKVSAHRHDFAAAIDLTLHPYVGTDVLGSTLRGSSPNTWTLENGVIAEGKNETEIRCTLPSSVTPGSAVSFRIEGHGLIPPFVPFLTLEAEVFQRGNLVAIDGGYISDQGGPPLKYAEYDLDLATAGELQVSLRYAAKSARPATLRINGTVVKSDALGGTTGGWTMDKQAWHVEGVYAFRAGKNVLRLERTGTFSHLDKLRLSKRVSPEVAGDASVYATASAAEALRAGLHGLRHPRRDLAQHLVLGVGPAFPSFFDLSSAAPMISWEDTSRPAFVQVEVQRKEGFDGGLEFKIEGLPDGVTVDRASLTLNKESSRLEAKLIATGEIAAGTYELSVRARATYKNQPEERALGVRLRVGE